MSVIQIRAVRTGRQRRAFLTFPWSIYRGDPLWVPPLLPERRKQIDPRRGPFFQRGGEAEFFTAHQGGRLAGTLCLAEDRVTNQARNQQDCIVGFFECIQDYRVAEAMFTFAARWAAQRGLKTLYGPFNLDYEDSYGVLVEGRERPPALLCGHTLPYYQEYFERFGFRPARGDNLAFAVDLDLTTPAAQRLARLAERLRQRGWIRVRSADLVHWEDEIERVYLLINAALAHLPDYIPWQREALHATLAQFRQIVDPELVLFAEVEGRAVGWFPGIPNLNEAFLHANGLRYPWNFLRLWRDLKRQPACLAIKSVLVLPEYWDAGVSVLLFDEMARRAASKGYQWVDLSLTSDDNPYTPALAEKMGARVYKRYRVYRLPVSQVDLAHREANST
ncbi:MAG: GNAT family N-acetyltransferase [Anaerolineales bacterium]|nr:GNAT family N-acetyltransferase [Anaerolineales bacterium]